LRKFKGFREEVTLLAGKKIKTRNVREEGGLRRERQKRKL